MCVRTFTAIGELSTPTGADATSAEAVISGFWGPGANGIELGPVRSGLPSVQQLLIALQIVDGNTTAVSGNPSFSLRPFHITNPIST